MRPPRSFSASSLEPVMSLAAIMGLNRAFGLYSVSATKPDEKA
ncbi:hypothetical protein [Roseibium sp. MMSF_3412]|nr:hypothetical protein [Roseibium sp. MMSF_3412]